MRCAGLAAIAAISLLAGGCRVSPVLQGGPVALPERVELTTTPFFPQEDYQCGPAALATLLGASGVEASPAALVDEVYIPARRGSLQTELLAAARQRGRIPFVVDPGADALAALLADGYPVLVLLNLGVRSWPIWHYAVVIGYEHGARRVLLRSGTTRRARMSWRRFRGAWARANDWGFVALRPGDVPRSARAPAYAAAVASFERVDPPAALLSYRAGTARWPDEPLLRLGIANALLARGDRAGAEAVLRDLLARTPGDVAARNNYAEILSQRGCRDAALAEIGVARGLARDTAFAAAVDATAAEIAARAAEPGAACPR